MSVESPNFFRGPEIGEGEIMHRYAIAYDGHGLQFPGMGKEYLEAHPEAQRYFDLAGEVLGYDLSEICINGSKEQLNRTESAQPAIVVYNLIAYHALREAMPQQMRIKPSAIAFQSLGGLNAMHRAGMLGEPESDDSIRSLVGLAAVRGKLMQEESDKVDGGMWLVSGARRGERPKKRVKRVFPKVVNYFERNNVVAAIERNEVQTVVSGLTKDFDKVNASIGKRLKDRYKIVPIRLPGACGPFHSEYMRPAAAKFEAILRGVDLKKDPEISIQSNSSPVRLLKTREEVIQELVNGITGKVYGIEMANHFLDEDLPTIEIGEKMLIGDTLIFDERFEDAKKIHITKRTAAVGGGVAIATIGLTAAGFLLIRKYSQPNNEEEQ